MTNGEQAADQAIDPPTHQPITTEPTDEQRAYSRDLALYNHRQSILVRLAAAVDNAADRLRQAAAGEGLFTSDADLKMTLRLLDLLPQLLELLPDEPPDDPDAKPDDDRKNKDRLPASQFHICRVCGVTGHDWYYCPKKPADWHPTHGFAHLISPARGPQAAKSPLSE